MNEAPPELVGLGIGIAEYFQQHCDEFKKGAKVTLAVDFGKTIDVEIFIEIPSKLTATLRLDHKGKWHVMEYDKFTAVGVNL